MKRVSDHETGLGWQLPRGWRELSLPGIPLAAVPVAANPIFSSSLIATVSDMGGRDIDDLVLEATAEWLRATPTGRVVDGYEVEDPRGQSELRLLHGVYSIGVASVSLVSVLLAHEGLLTRVDLSVLAVDSGDATEVLFDLVETISLPSASPRVRPPGSATELVDRLHSAEVNGHE